MKIARRIIFWLFLSLIVIPIVVFAIALLRSQSGDLLTGFASVALPAQGLAAFGMLIWSAVCLEVEPRLTRVGILFAALAILLLDFVSS